MDEYLKKLGYDFIKTSIDLPNELLEYINNDFIINNDCILIKDNYNHFGNPKLDSDLEKCEWEYSETHFHPDNNLPYGENEMQILSFCLESAKKVAQRLTSNFAEKKFRIIVSFSETTFKDGEIELYGGGSVRFHQIRPSAEIVMRTNNLNDYKSEAVVEIEV